jgi:hypothetical protein
MTKYSAEEKAAQCLKARKQAVEGAFEYARETGVKGK